MIICSTVLLTTTLLSFYLIMCNPNVLRQKVKAEPAADPYTKPRSTVPNPIGTVPNPRKIAVPNPRNVFQTNDLSQ